MCHASLSIHPSMMNLSAGKQWRSRYGEQNCGHSGGSRGWDGWREWPGNMHITLRRVTASGDFSYDSGHSNQCPVSTWSGWGRVRGETEVQDRGDVCLPMPDSC